MAERFEESARAADKERASFQALSNTPRAGEALIMRAEMLFAATERGSDRRTQAVGALLEAGRLLAKDESERPRAAETLLDAGRKAFDILETNRGSYDPDLQRTVVESLSEARTLYERMGEFEKADESHYLASRIRRKRFRRSGRLGYLDPGFLLSLLLDISWGYGTRPRRLLPSASVVVLVFGALYLFVGDVRWGNGATGADYTTRALAALVLSVTALLPAQLMERIATLKLLPPIVVSHVGEVLVFLESAVGLALMAMAAFSLTRWIKRRHLLAGHD